MCCVVAAVPDLDKPAFTPCPLLRTSPDGCCSVAAEPGRPDICAAYRCAWLDGLGTDDDRPDSIGAMFSINRTERGVIGFAIETEPDAMTTSARDMAVTFARGHQMPLIVGAYGKDTAGEWIILHDALRERASSILGAEVARLASDVTMYERREPHG